MGSAEDEEVDREAGEGPGFSGLSLAALILLHGPRLSGRRGHSAHPHPGCPNLIGEKMDGTEAIYPLAPLSIPAPDLDLCSGDRLAVWDPALSEPGPEPLTWAGALTPTWRGRKGRAVEEFHLASIPRMQLLICPSPEVEMGTARRQLCVHCP